jgi:hypothetical protein
MKRLVLLFAALLVAGCGEKSTMEDPRIPEGVGGPPLKSATEIVKASSESPNPPAAESLVAESPVAESPVAESPIAEPSLSQSRSVPSNNPS